MLGRKIARHSVAILGTALLGGLLSATMVRLAPGFDTDEAQIDSHLNSESLRALHEARSQQNNILVFYLHSLKRALQGDLGSSLTLHQPVSQLLRQRAPLTLRLIGIAFFRTRAIHCPLQRLQHRAEFLVLGAQPGDHLDQDVGIAR